MLPKSANKYTGEASVVDELPGRRYGLGLAYVDAVQRGWLPRRESEATSERVFQLSGLADLPQRRPLPRVKYYGARPTGSVRCRTHGACGRR